MPWYRQGTVAITAGQTTVVGTGVDFALNSRVGDAFQGPDGRWYEVANIASSTVLSILPAYLGPTVSGGSFGLAPMQGYPKDLVDRFREIVNQFGGTLAIFGDATDAPGARQRLGAAGSGPNSDITSLAGLTTALSIEQGGTGAKTAGAAREALGLRTVSSVNDATPGRIPTVGWMGLGSGAPAFAANLNSPEVTSFMAFAVGAANRPPSISYGTVLTVYYGAGYAIQQAWSTTGTYATAYRWKAEGTWQAWVDTTPVGVGQSWKVVTSSRAVNTNFVNTTGRTVYPVVALGPTTLANAYAQWVVTPAGGAVTGLAPIYATGTGQYITAPCIPVPPGANYQLSTAGAGSPQYWTEFGA